MSRHAATRGPRHRAATPTSYRSPKVPGVPRRRARIHHPALIAVPATALTASALVALLALGGHTSADATPAAAPEATTTAPTATVSVATQALAAPVRAAAAVHANAARPALSRSLMRQDVEQIPSVAAAAYQRAETVMTRASQSCDPAWTLLAAIGAVASDHGRTNGSSLDEDGVATPAIYGTEQTRVDTDAGQLDQDRRHDRAVGPMQMLPATWAVVGVDADGDGQRNPQDIDDAALAAGVFLCGDGNGDLSEPKAVRAALARWNPNPAYARQVLAIARGYDADLAAAAKANQATTVVTVPTSTIDATPSADPSTTPSASASTTPSQAPTKQPPTHAPTHSPSSTPTKPPHHHPHHTPSPSPTTSPTPTTEPSPTEEPTGSPSTASGVPTS